MHKIAGGKLLCVDQRVPSGRIRVRSTSHDRNGVDWLYDDLMTSTGLGDRPPSHRAVPLCAPFDAPRGGYVGAEAGNRLRERTSMPWRSAIPDVRNLGVLASKFHYVKEVSSFWVSAERCKQQGERSIDVDDKR
jgi:hypothetical protein